ncbi:hypothetical protein BC835DRAFT_267915 [Cytidiella melzeri]|nr:hypothetical protein BC835DRAFT_267915 [Cytidiella melzeri]
MFIFMFSSLTFAKACNTADMAGLVKGSHIVNGHTYCMQCIYRKSPQQSLEPHAAMLTCWDCAFTRSRNSAWLFVSLFIALRAMLDVWTPSKFCNQRCSTL